MSDYIKREDAINMFEETSTAIPEKRAIRRIEEVPAADVRENVRGEWLRYGEDGFPNAADTVWWQCSKCMNFFRKRMKANRTIKFCPNCGAYMKGVKSYEKGN